MHLARGALKRVRVMRATYIGLSLPPHLLFFPVMLSPVAPSYPPPPPFSPASFLPLPVLFPSPFTRDARSCDAAARQAIGDTAAVTPILQGSVDAMDNNLTSRSVR